MPVRDDEGLIVGSLRWVGVFLRDASFGMFDERWVVMLMRCDLSRGLCSIRDGS